MVKEKIKNQHRFIQEQNSNLYFVDKQIHISKVDLKSMEGEIKMIPVNGNDDTSFTISKANNNFHLKSMIQNTVNIYQTNSLEKTPFINPLNFSKSIEVDFFLEKKIFQSKTEKKYKKDYQNVTFIHRYQSHYINGNATGFGDFLRGSYYLLQYCEEREYTCRIDFSNHLLSLFLKNKINSLIANIKPPISKFTDINVDLLIKTNNEITNSVKNNYELFEDFLNNQEIINNLLFLYANSFPLHPLSLLHKKRMRFLLEPSEEISTHCQQVLQRIDLDNQPFTVIHIRLGDEYLVEKENKFDGLKLELLKIEIELIVQTSRKYLLIADNNAIKKYMIRWYPFFKTYFKEITHFGEGIILEREKVKNTMIDFYLMSQAQRIFSFSSYLHGSGFSKWCAETYDIPYTCNYIK